VEHNLVKIEDLEAANERLLEVMATGAAPAVLGAGILAYEMKVLREEDVLHHAVDDRWRIGLVDLRDYEVPDEVRKKSMDPDACWATWSVPFDREEDFYFVATAYYLSPAVRAYLGKATGRPDPLVQVAPSRVIADYLENARGTRGRQARPPARARPSSRGHRPPAPAVRPLRPFTLAPADGPQVPLRPSCPRQALTPN
jgi:hypothetical protein